MRLRVLALALALWPLAAPAQDSAASAEDKGFLTNFLEDNLSGAGREVRIDGFAGALSSRATFERLTIADDLGIWLTIEGGALAWNRTALLSGRVEIAEMTARDIDVARRPGGAPSGEPTASQVFALPELPVAVRIGQLRADRVALGADILGEALAFQAEGSASLEGGDGEAEFKATRTDGGTTGAFSLTARYSNASRRAALDLLASEGKGGIVARLAGLPGEPSIVLALNGGGPVADFLADVALSTDGAPRLTGQIGFGARGGDFDKGQRVSVDLSGDVTPLFEPAYRPFFGAEAHLRARGQRLGDGRLELSMLDIASQALTLSGEAALAADGAPRRVKAEIVLTSGEGGAIVLPIPGPETTVTGADLRVAFDAARDEGWALDGTVNGLRRAEVSVGQITLDGSGRIAPARAGGTVTLAVDGLTAGDDRLSAAVGATLSGRTVFSWQKGGALRLPVVVLSGEDYTISGRAALAGESLTTDANLAARDLARFAAISGMDLRGSATLAISGGLDLGTGEVAARLGGTGTDLRLGIEELDRLLTGATTFAAEIAGQAEDLDLKSAAIEATGFSASAAGRIAAGATDLSADLSIDDLGRVRDRFGGAASAKVRLTEEVDARHIEATLRTVDARLGNPALNRVMAGEGRAEIALTQRGERLRLDRLELATRELTATLAPLPEDPETLRAEARLADTTIFVPELPGPTALSGTVRQGETFGIDMAVTGPGGIDARLAGEVAPDLSRATLAARGQLRAEAANSFIAPRAASGVVRFDLAMDGPPALSALSGRISTEGMRLADPTVFVAVEGLAAQADLSAGRLGLSAAGGFRDGGRLEAQGSIALSPGLDADLTLTLDRAALRDPQLFQTEASGTVRLSGPLARGGAIEGTIDLAQTDIRVATASFGATRSIPEIAHLAEPARVRASRARAGLAGAAAETRGPAHAMRMDLRINAPQRIFVRGRGLDAELGGSLLLGGTTASIVPAGQFELIRGRLDILTKRLTITEGLVEMRGALEPYLRFVATHQSDTVTTTVTIEGPATAPEIRFSSSPELPEEEVVSQLLFGRGVQTLSVFQAAQLASAVATLTGKGGEGIIGRLRSSLGVDDLDVSTDETGGTTLRAGKYISEKVYTDLSVDSEGKSEINLNLDIRKGLKARGTVGSDGTTGLGIFFEKDY
ncbi:translocation/assembly module TamB domain-containing protein [Albidovulum sediminicola]|uniref:Translocation/assembly module TamB domain-containing protein n=1 Tax=Albidovulum sediminicola TaxID=2984331 RepID=A0ABT2YWY5_9RHOB|nr:translocation/assembly module TamB domain-containing protein [Defluviimonas sp. WL0075]MCV2863272.1 translocation/assembly module TamB domain-containing protein [Defluviimonas sp. WL0075]